MESVVRAVLVYLFLPLVFRISGKRTLSEASTFDLVLLLIISETTQQAMVDNDHSMTNAAILILTLVGSSILMSLIKHWSPAVDRWIEGVPLIVVKDGMLLHEAMNTERVDENDILEAAREMQGLERIGQIKYAVLERGGQITIVPKPQMQRDPGERALSKTATGQIIDGACPPIPSLVSIACSASDILNSISPSSKRHCPATAIGPCGGSHASTARRIPCAR